MNRRSTGVMLMLATGAAVVIGVITLIVAFVSSSLVLTYVSFGLMVVAPVLALAGLVFLILSFVDHR